MVITRQSFILHIYTDQRFCYSVLTAPFRKLPSCWCYAVQLQRLAYLADIFTEINELHLSF
jgi:hypothetical protein